MSHADGAIKIDWGGPGFKLNHVDKLIEHISDCMDFRAQPSLDHTSRVLTIYPQIPTRVCTPWQVAEYYDGFVGVIGRIIDEMKKAFKHEPDISYPYITWQKKGPAGFLVVISERTGLDDSDRAAIMATLRSQRKIKGVMPCANDSFLVTTKSQVYDPRVADCIHRVVAHKAQNKVKTSV